VIQVDRLVVVEPRGHPVLDGVSLSVAARERVGVVGESGSGKTTLALALLGAVRRGLRLTGGRVGVAGHDMLALRGAALRAVRRRVIAYLPQDPPSTLTPTMRVGAQIAELAGGSDVAAHLDRLGLPTDRAFQRRFPHQLSGGQQRRLALARTLAGDPQVLVLDEPINGLDGPTRAAVLDEIAELTRARAMTLLFITHDLAAAARIADRLVVVRAGTIVEDGGLSATLAAPTSPYTAELVRAVPALPEAFEARAPARSGAVPVLEVRDLRASHGARRRVVVADGVSFTVARGECVALLARSGAGKTTLARCVTGLHRPDSGAVVLDGVPLPAALRDRTVEQRRRIQLVAQDPTLSLNPRRTAGAAVARPLRRLRGLSRAASRAETGRLLGLVGLDPGLAARLPAQLSGGQRQRVAIARALAAAPEILLCDEVTAGLDTRVQAAVLDLIADLRRRLGLAVLLITHDLGVVARTADRVLVLVDGAIREEGPVGEVLGAPRHEATRALVATALAVPAAAIGRPAETHSPADAHN